MVGEKNTVMDSKLIALIRICDVVYIKKHAEHKSVFLFSYYINLGLTRMKTFYSRHIAYIKV